MPSLSDIPCVGKVVEMISSDTTEGLKREFLYMYKYKENVDVLKAKMEELGVQEKKIKRKVERDTDDGKTIEDHVLKWQQDVQQIKDEVEEFLRMCFLNVCSRCRMGREVVKKTEKVMGLADTGIRLVDGEISYRPRFVYADLSNTTSFDNDYVSFESREDAYKKILEALNNKDAGFVVGIYGMAGAGKTRMMEQAWKQAKKDGIFDEVARADVSNEKLDVRKLQGQLASCLNLDLPSEKNEEMRADLLAKRLTQKGNKILMLFDDVWQELPLNKIGVPSGDGRSKGCKILLTSRIRDVCFKNNCEDPIEIKVLKEEEGWDLFEKNVGSSTINSLNDKSLAKKVCDECACLPLVIAAVGKALKGKPHDSWKDALGQLHDSKLENIDGIDPKVYAGLVLSFNHLLKDAKSCLFLCSVFPEDAAISIEELVRLVKGNRLIEDLGTLEKARDRVRSMVVTLKNSSLLLPHDDDTKVKLHDIIRDVVKSVAAKDPAYAFLEKGCGMDWPDVNYKDRKLISLSFDNINDFPCEDDLACPELHTLVVNLKPDGKCQQFPDRFFRGFPNLRVLVLKVQSNSHLPSSLQSLTNLRMLSLYNADLNMSLIKELKNLEMFIILDDDTKELSPELRELKRLRLLDMSRNDSDEMIMPRHLLSSLSNLEELYIPRGFSLRVKEEGGGGGDPNPLHHELSKLTNLTTLHIHLPDAMFLPNEKKCQKLLRYVIQIAPEPKFNPIIVEKRVLRLHKVAMQGRSSSLEILLESVEYMKLMTVNGFQTYFNHGKAFANLARLSISRCDDLEHLGRLPQNYQQLPNHQPMIMSFSKLTELRIQFSSGFKYLFCPSIARNLLQLRTLMIINCTMMEEIIRPREQNEEEEEIIEFPNLREMDLYDLPRLKSFYCKKINMWSGTPDQNTSTFPGHSLFNGMGCTFPNLAHLSIVGCDDLEHLGWLPQNYQQHPHHQPMIMSFSKLTEIQIVRSGFKYLFCPSSARCLVQLRNLSIRECTMIEEIIRPREQEEDEEEIIEFPNLKDMVLRNLPRLKSFYCKKINMWSATPDQNPSTFPVHSLFNGMGCTFPNLELLSIWDCDDLEHLGRLPQNYQQLPHHQPMIMSFSKLTELRIVSNSRFKYLFCPSSARYLVQLRTLSICDCRMMEEIIRPLEQEKEEEEEIIDFPNLREVNLNGLPRLKSFYFKKINMWSATPDQNPSTFPVHSLFNGMDCTFPNLANLSIRGCDDLEHLGRLPQNYQQLPRHQPMIMSFSKLTELRIENSGFKYLFCPSSARRLVQLRNLSILDCTMMEEIIRPREQEEEEEEIIEFSNLRDMRLHSLPRLKSFYCKKINMRSATPDQNTSTFPVHSLFNGMVSFPVLEELRMSSIENVKEIWAPQCHTKNSFSQLKILDVRECHKLENVIPFGMLQRLQNMETLEVGDCSSLKCIVNEAKTATIEDQGSDIVFPVLKTLILSDVAKLDKFWCTRSMGTNTDQHQPSLLQKVSFPVLEELRMYSIENVKEIWAPQCHTKNSFSQLKMLSVGFCHKLENVIPFAMLQRLQNMETLQVRDCSSLKCIVNGAKSATTKDQEEADSEIVFPILKTLELLAVPKLDNFWCTRSMGSNIIDQHQSSLLQKVSFPRLDNLMIDVKLNWEHISLGDSAYQLKSLTICKLYPVLFSPDWLVRLQNLEALEVVGISSNVSDLVDLIGLNANLLCDHGIHDLLCFRGLKKLFVVDCNLSTLFTCSLAKTNLQQLEQLIVRSCQKMEEIVTDENEGNEKMVATGTNAHDDEILIVFPLLKTIDLGNLPVLKSFCGSASYAFNMPSLEKVVLQKCPLMINFTCRQLTTPQFRIGDNDWNTTECTDLNEYLQTLLGPEGGTLKKRNKPKTWSLEQAT